MNEPGNQNASIEPLLSLAEVARILGVCVRSVKRYVDRGELPKPVRVGGRLRLFKSDVESYQQGLRGQRMK